jgi:hypothetical protein
MAKGEVNRGWTISEVLMTLATLLAAVAAACSAFAAFRQETATFTSNLYSKQVDAVSALLASFAKSTGALDRMANDSKDRTNGVPGYKIYPESEIQAFATPDNDMLSKYYVAAIILPDHIVSNLRDLNLEILDIRFNVTSAFGKMASESNFQKFVIDVAKIGKDLDAAHSCLSEQFRLGSPISDPPFDACIARQAPEGGRHKAN